MANMNLPEDHGAGNATPHRSNERKPGDRKPTPSGERWWGARILEEVVRGMFRADEEADRSDDKAKAQEHAQQQELSSSKSEPFTRDEGGEEDSVTPPEATVNGSSGENGSTLQADVLNGPQSIGKGRGDRLNDAYSQSVADLHRLANFYYNRGHFSRAQEIYSTLEAMRNQKRGPEIHESDGTA